MYLNLIKTILGGALLGAALFFIPFFLFKVLVVIVLIGILTRVFKRGSGYRSPNGWAFADKVRNMNDDEYANFKKRMSDRRCGYYHHQAGQSNTNQS